MALRVTVDGIGIELDDIGALAALIKALRTPIVPPVPVARAAQVGTRAAVQARRDVLVAALRAGGEQLGHELLARPEMASYPKSALFNDLITLEKSGLVVRGEHGYLLSDSGSLPAAHPLSGMPASSDRLVG